MYGSRRNSKMRVVFLIVVFCTYFQDVVVGLHSSRLKFVKREGIDITDQFGKLRGTSDPSDSDGVCYGTHGEKAREAEAALGAGLVLPGAPQQPLPRCHSEFYLLRAILSCNIPLRGCYIVIENSKYKPCSMTYGMSINAPNFQHTEYNPGMPCDRYLQVFAEGQGCHILVTYPGGSKSYQ